MTPRTPRPLPVGWLDDGVPRPQVNLPARPAWPEFGFDPPPPAICSLIVGGGLVAYSLASGDFRRQDHLLRHQHRPDG